MYLIFLRYSFPAKAYLNSVMNTVIWVHTMWVAENERTLESNAMFKINNYWRFEEMYRLQLQVQAVQGLLGMFTLKNALNPSKRR